MWFQPPPAAPCQSSLPERSLQEPVLWSKNGKLVAASWQRAPREARPLEGYPTPPPAAVWGRKLALSLACLLNKLCRGPTMCQSGAHSQLWFWSQPENVPPRLMDPWASHLTSLSRGGFLHLSARKRAGIGQVRREGQVCRGQR